MFETLVTGLLTSALGNYIDARCFSSDKINVAVWSGYVVLHQLELKPDVIAHPALRLVRGVVGSIELKIPWNRLHSDSVVVTVDDVYVLVRTEEDIERAVLEMDEHALKKKLLEELYAHAKRQDEAASESSAGDSGFAARLVNKIIDNLEVRVWLWLYGCIGGCLVVLNVLCVSWVAMSLLSCSCTFGASTSVSKTTRLATIRSLLGSQSSLCTSR